MKRLVSALLLICFLLPTMFVGGVSAKSILEWSEVYDLVHHSTVYYDASDPHHTVYGDNQYAYECYVSKDVGFREMLVFFEKDGAIIRDQTVNEHLISMYYAQNFDSVVSFYEGLSVCDNIIAAANGIKLNQVVDDIASAAAESLGGLTAMYLTGGAMSLSKIAESVAVQTIENLTSHFVDISTIISEAQLNLLFANASRLKYLRGKLDGSWDLRSFAECERFSSYAEEMERICDATVEFLPFLIGDMSTNPVEILPFIDKENPRSPGNMSVAGMKCVKMGLGEPDDSGRRRPIVVEGSEHILDVDCVIMSLGTSPNPLIKSTTEGLETEYWGGIIVDENGLTSKEAIYAGGDAVTGSATVILAMGAGKTAANAIDDYIQSKKRAFD